MSVKLDGKFIPMEYYKEYNGNVYPDERNKISPEGEERKSKKFPFRITLDKFGHVYFIPIVCKRCDDGGTYWEIAYTINDIVEAASGSAVKRKLICDVHDYLKKQYLNVHVMDDNFVDAFVNMARDTFTANYVKNFNKQPNIPKTVTTYSRLTADEAKELAKKALKVTQ